MTSARATSCEATALLHHTRHYMETSSTTWVKLWSKLIQDTSHRTRQSDNSVRWFPMPSTLTTHHCFRTGWHKSTGGLRLKRYGSCVLKQC